MSRKSRNRRVTRNEISNQRLRSPDQSFPALAQVPYLPVGTVFRSPPSSPVSTPSNKMGRVGQVSGRPLADARKSAQRTTVSGIKAIRPSGSFEVGSPPRPTKERQTMVCVRRSERCEVLHAFQKTGTGGQKSPVYNWQSKIHCKGRK